MLCILMNLIRCWCIMVGCRIMKWKVFVVMVRCVGCWCLFRWKLGWKLGMSVLLMVLCLILFSVSVVRSNCCFCCVMIFWLDWLIVENLKDVWSRCWMMLGKSMRFIFFFCWIWISLGWLMIFVGMLLEMNFWDRLFCSCVFWFGEGMFWFVWVGMSLLFCCWIVGLRMLGLWWIRCGLKYRICDLCGIIECLIWLVVLVWWVWMMKLV